MIDVEQTIISQYGNSATITALIQNMNAYVDPRTDFDNFFNYVWNVETARGFGLDIWGRIVNISRNLYIPSDAVYFGFRQALPGVAPFNNAPFYNRKAVVTDTYTLADDAYRKLILVKALANISATNSRSINTLLTNLFADRGRAYILDLGNMSARYVFEFIPTSWELAIIENSGALPRPCGVELSAIFVDNPTFGFSESGGLPIEGFDVGTLYSGVIYAIT